MKYVVLGCGQFGRLAIKRLLSITEPSAITAVDQDPSKLINLHDGCHKMCGEAIEALNTINPAPRDTILPMVPIHLAARFVCRRGDLVAAPLPSNLSDLLPNSMKLDSCNLVCSRASFCCPDDCPEDGACSITGEFREPLYDDIARLELPDHHKIILRSFQILPGVGGYLYSVLLSVLENCRSGNNLIVTSCKCHAAVTAVFKS